MNPISKKYRIGLNKNKLLLRIGGIAFLLWIALLGTYAYAFGGCWTCTTPSPQISQKTWYPDKGKFEYTGSSNRVYLDFKWKNPGNWFRSGSIWRDAIEIDFGNYARQGKLPFKACRSYSNLPLAYSDCRTAGVSENKNSVAFGFGTFDATSISKDYWYFTTIDLFRSSDYSFYYRRGMHLAWNLVAQELDSTSCNNPWCLLTKYRPHHLIHQSDLDVYRKLKVSW